MIPKIYLYRGNYIRYVTKDIFFNKKYIEYLDNILRVLGDEDNEVENLFSLDDVVRLMDKIMYEK